MPSCDKLLLLLLTTVNVLAYFKVLACEGTLIIIRITVWAKTCNIYLVLTVSHIKWFNKAVTSRLWAGRLIVHIWLVCQLFGSHILRKLYLQVVGSLTWTLPAIWGNATEVSYNLAALAVKPPVYFWGVLWSQTSWCVDPMRQHVKFAEHWKR